jgi:co-chaperonin GroES (HSP10)
MKALPHIAAAMVAESDYRNSPEVLARFPQVSPSVVPTGARVLVQLMSHNVKTQSGIILVEETKDTERWNMQVARVLAVGDLAFCNRETGLSWLEGAWCEPGDFVIVPRWGGQRRTVKGPEGMEVHFATINDHEVIERVYGNPLTLETYYLG